MSYFRNSFFVCCLVLTSTLLTAENRPKIAVLSIDSKDLVTDQETLTNLVNLELEKTNRFEVLDKYDVRDILKKNNIVKNECYGKSCLIRAGKILDVQKVLSGSIEKVGEKLIIILRIVDINSESFEKADVMEYIYQMPEIQFMIRISINNLLGIQNDQNLVNLLVNYSQPITSPKTTVKLNGPRIGAAWTFGEVGKKLQTSKEKGGFNSFPLSSMFGYQFEKQYLSSGDFQALIEAVPSINGLESGNFFPSLVFMNGFRFNKSGFEFGVGPVFRAVKTAKGYYDENGDWKLVGDTPVDPKYNVVESIDSRGDFTFSTGLILAVGKTIKSGYLNIPLNLYISPKKDGLILGFSFGFNVARSKM